MLASNEIGEVKMERNILVKTLSGFVNEFNQRNPSICPAALKLTKYIPEAK